MSFWLRRPSYLSVWNHRIRLTYWGLVLLPLAVLLAAALLFCAYDPDRLETLVRRQTLWQNGLYLAMLVLAELLYRWQSRLQDYIVLSVGCCYGAITLISSPQEIYGVQIVMILPIVTAILYFDRGKVIFAGLASLALYWMITIGLQYHDHHMYAMAGSCMIAGTAFAAAAIVGRGMRLIANEREALLNEQKHRLQQRIIEETYRKDALTGLDNHKTFQERIRFVLEEESLRPLCLAVIDIDDFKSVNDTYGHSVGDMVLRKVGSLLRAREGEHLFPSRYGGEEFTVIFARCEEAEVGEILEQLRAETAALTFPELEGRAVTISIGCCRHTSALTLDEWFKLADKALYEAKRSGKNRVVWDKSSPFIRKEGGSRHG